MKRKPQLLIILSFVGCLSSVLLVAKSMLKSHDRLGHSISDKVSVGGQDGRLSVEETIGLSLLGESLPYHLFKRANPDAKDELYRLLDTDDDGLHGFQANAYWILGYLGDANDAIRLQKTLRDFSGVLSGARQKKAIAVFYSLGLMSRRGVDVASKILDEMMVYDYWVDSFKWRPDELVTKDHLTAELESLAWVILAQTIGGQRKDLTAVRMEILKTISNPERRQFMAHRIDPDRARREAETIVREEQKATTAEERTILRHLYDQREERMESFSEAYKVRPRSQL